MTTIQTYISDPLALLTVEELDHGAKIINADVVDAITRKTYKRVRALAVVAWLLAKRHAKTSGEKTHPDLKHYNALTYVEVTRECERLARVVQDVPDDGTPKTADELCVALLAVIRDHGIELPDELAAVIRVDDDEDAAVDEQPVDGVDADALNAVAADVDVDEDVAARPTGHAPA